LQDKKAIAILKKSEVQLWEQEEKEGQRHHATIFHYIEAVCDLVSPYSSIGSSAPNALEACRNSHGFLQTKVQTRDSA